jgi:hypothetical protein
MPKSNADYQREHRERRAARLAELAAQNEALRAEAEGLRTALEAAEGELERLSGEACPHPSGSVVDGVCQLCKAEVW